MNIDQRDQYFVAMKVFLEKDGKFLIIKDGFGDWDLPGGRIQKDEFETSFEDIIQRLMKKEIGGDVKYRLGKPILHMRHERVEAKEGNPTVRIFAVGFTAEYLGGDIKLQSHHNEILWADPKTFKPEDYFTGGWLKGVREYLEIKNR